MRRRGPSAGPGPGRRSVPARRRWRSRRAGLRLVAAAVRARRCLGEHQVGRAGVRAERRGGPSSDPPSTAPACCGSACSPVIGWRAAEAARRVGEPEGPRGRVGAAGIGAPARAGRALAEAGVGVGERCPGSPGRRGCRRSPSGRAPTATTTCLYQPGRSCRRRRRAPRSRSGRRCPSRRRSGTAVGPGSTRAAAHRAARLLRVAAVVDEALVVAVPLALTLNVVPETREFGSLAALEWPAAR